MNGNNVKLLGDFYDYFFFRVNIGILFLYELWGDFWVGFYYFSGFFYFVFFLIKECVV